MPRKARAGPWGAGGEAVAERPLLAVKIAVIANLWTSIEGHMAYALGSMIGSDDRVAMAILSKVQTATAKSQMIRAIGKASLPPFMQPELGQVLGAFDALAPARNKVVHGLWGTTEAEPEGLLWVPPNAPSRLSLGMIAAMKAGRAEEHIKEVLSGSELWEASDFDAIIADLSRLASESASFASKMQALTTATEAGLDIDTIKSHLDERQT